VVEHDRLLFVGATNRVAHVLMPREVRLRRTRHPRTCSFPAGTLCQVRPVRLQRRAQNLGGSPGGGDWSDLAYCACACTKAAEWERLVVRGLTYRCNCTFSARLRWQLSPVGARTGRTSWLMPPQSVAHSFSTKSNPSTRSTHHRGHASFSLRGTALRHPRGPDFDFVNVLQRRPSRPAGGRTPLPRPLPAPCTSAHSI
jgi:hypothetical protein